MVKMVLPSPPPPPPPHFILSHAVKIFYSLCQTQISLAKGSKSLLHLLRSFYFKGGSI